MEKSNPFSFSLRVLVVDDTLFYRKIICDILAQIPGIEVVGSAGNGKLATYRITSLKPDLLTLDIEMPEMNGLEVLEWTKQHAPNVGSVIISSFAQKGGEMTVRALELGAFDYIEKPEASGKEENEQLIREKLMPVLDAYRRLKEIKEILKGSNIRKKRVEEKVEIEEREEVSPLPERRIIAYRRKSLVVAIGISTGGPETLAKMLPMLPEDIGVPILIVQHMPAAFTHSISSSLDSKCSLKVKAGQDGEDVLPNIVYMAPGGKQMKVVKSADGKTKIIRLTDDHPENNCKPSADYLFRSVAHVYNEQATGVIMTGMGSDGTLGLKLMRRAGAFIIAQNEETCTVYGMPKAPIEAGIVDSIAPLGQIAEEILRTIKL